MVATGYLDPQKALRVVYMERVSTTRLKNALL